MSTSFPRAVSSVIAAAACAVHAQEPADSGTLEPVVVFGTPAPLDIDLPHNAAGRTADQLRRQNLVNPEDALRHLPAVTIRKRYIGDRNALVGGRSFGTLQPSRALVYADGYLLSNFLGRFDAPRWNMLTPESIERVDILHGPYSPLYPGNSIGTTVLVSERAPRGFEASGRVTSFRQRFDAYGHADHYDGHQGSLHLGDRLASGLWYAVDLNHQQATSQPMQYVVLKPRAIDAGDTPVTGIRQDTDAKGERRAIAGAGNGAIDRTGQRTGKLKLGYDFSPTVTASGLLAAWDQRSRPRNESFLRDAAGRPVTSAGVTDGQTGYDIPAAAFAPSRRDEQHLQTGFTLKTRHARGWNGSLVLSDYRILRDTARQSSPTDENPGTGSVTKRSGTGWYTMELQAAYTPLPGDFGNGRHALTFGLHRNAYRLDHRVREADDWLRAGGHLQQFYRGRTRTEAIYAQDAWRLTDTLTLTYGLRWERYTAYDGEQRADGDRHTQYPSRRMTAASPKASLAWWASDELQFKLSAGRGVRFPNVEELYNNALTSSSQAISDPGLRAERSHAVEASAAWHGLTHMVRLSVFRDDVRDAILRQNDATLIPTQTKVLNVERVLTHGIEIVWQATNWPARGWSLDSNVAYARAKTVSNPRNPASEGKDWPRVPRVRGSLQLSWRPSDRWMASAALRRASRSYNELDNSDTHASGYASMSELTQLDLRASVKLQPKLEWALGIDNVADQRAWQHHPYPGRTVFTELRWAH